MQEKSATAASRTHNIASASDTKNPDSSRIRINYEGLRTFNRYVFVGGSILLVAAVVQAMLFNRLLDRVDSKLSQHTLLMQETSQNLLQGLKPMNTTLGDDFSKRTSREGQAALISPKEIRTVQEVLKQKGFYPGDTNGQYDKKTKSALKKFQVANNLPSEGATLDLLLNLNAEHIRQQMQ
ncbi:MAG: peptidoglycan-binding protein [Saprospiraceae bacterium]|nr:peptidoglycan-binding protein [Saprospiraceae bacterium]